MPRTLRGRPGRAVFLVSLDVPEGSSLAEMKEYVLTEVRAGCGSRHPDDPVFSLDRESVRVRYQLHYRLPPRGEKK